MKNNKQFIKEIEKDSKNFEVEIEKLKRAFVKATIYQDGNPKKYLTNADKTTREVAREMLEEEKVNGNKNP